MENRLDQGIASELEAKRNEIQSLCRRTNVVSLDLFGRNVDLVTERSIRNPYFRKAVEASRISIYDRRNSQAPV